MATPVPPARDSGLVRAIESMLGFRRPPGRFLDVGAGRGGFSHAAKMAGLDVTALEVDPQDVRMLQAIGGLSVIPTTLEEFDEKPGSFDYVLMSHVLEHAHDPKQWIKKASMLLAPGGILAIMLPHFNSVYRFLVGTGDPYFFPPEHLNHFNRRSLGRQCTDCGLLEAGCRTETSFPSDVITKRVPMPNIIRWPVQRLTAIASAMAGRVTSATGCGHVLIAHYKKRGGA
ncbi:MAG: class I SAM-dependent methyltransferase [Tepidisphaeraceae bacterium]